MFQKTEKITAKLYYVHSLEKKNWYLNDILRHSVNIENENKFLHRQVYNIFVLFTHYLQEFTILLQKKYVQNWKWP